MSTNTSPNRYGNSALLAPTPRQTPRYGALTYAVLGSPLFYVLSSVPSSEQMVLACIITLLFICRPPKISFFIVPIYINAVKRVLRTWLSSDFCKKFFVGIKAKFNTASAIYPVFWISNVITPRFRTCVGLVFGRVHFARLTVLERESGSYLFPQTTTRFCSFLQIAVRANLDCATVTFAIPKYVSVIAFGIADNHQSSKSLVRSVFESFDGWKRLKNNVNILFSHSVIANSYNGLVRLARDVQNLWRAVSIVTQNLTNTYNLTGSPIDEASANWTYLLVR